MLEVKVLAIKTPQFYAVKRALLAGLETARRQRPDLALEITHIRDYTEIETFTCVLSWPSLVINGRLVCVGRFPSKDEVVGWLLAASDTDRQASAGIES